MEVRTQQLSLCSPTSTLILAPKSLAFFFNITSDFYIIIFLFISALLPQFPSSQLMGTLYRAVTQQVPVGHGEHLVRASRNPLS